MLIVSDLYIYVNCFPKIEYIFKNEQIIFDKKMISKWLLSGIVIDSSD